MKMQNASKEMPVIQKMASQYQVEFVEDAILTVQSVEEVSFQQPRYQIHLSSAWSARILSNSFIKVNVSTLALQTLPNILPIRSESASKQSLQGHRIHLH